MSALLDIEQYIVARNESIITKLFVKNDIRIIVGAGNDNLDYKRFAHEYDVAITNCIGDISEENMVILPVMTININNDNFINMLVRLSNKIKEITFDVSVVKFCDLNQAKLKIIHSCLIPNGQFNIEPLGGIAYAHIIEGVKPILSLIEKDKSIISAYEKKQTDNDYWTYYDSVSDRKGYVRLTRQQCLERNVFVRTKEDSIEHNEQLLESAGFVVELVDKYIFGHSVDERRPVPYFRCIKCV